MNKQIYFDNNATTKCDEEVLNAMLPFLKEDYGNPSSIYEFGKDVKEKITLARKHVAKLLNANEKEIIFTSCASESNVTAIMNAVKNNPNKKHIITTSVEHASILETMKYLEEIGYTVTYLSVDDRGRIDLEELKKSINDDTLLIAIMMANNEIGNIYPGKIPIDVKEMQVDTLSMSGHKIHTPKGIGILYVRDGLPYVPLIFGHQENNRRGGTENVPYIIGIGKATKMILEDNYEINKKLKYLRDKLEKEVKENIEDVMIYGDLDNRLPNTSSMAFKGVKSEELLLVLESFGICISTGSACNSMIAEPSHVLKACHADLENYSPIRISLGKYNTEEEVDIFVKNLITIVNMLRRRK